MIMVAHKVLIAVADGCIGVIVGSVLEMAVVSIWPVGMHD
jgi:hypothetical protein